MTSAIDETDKFIVEVLAQGIIRLLEVLYSRAIEDDLEEADYELIGKLREVFYDFFKDLYIYTK